MRISHHRLKIFQYVVLIGFVTVAIRMVSFQFFPPDADKLARISNVQYRKTLKLSGTRGDILDRNGDKLAVSVQAASLYVNPQIFRPNAGQIQAIAKILDVSKTRVERLTKKRAHFSWLKRKARRKQADQILAMQIDGIHVLYEPSRVYPSGSILSPLLGNVSIDSHGLAGIELQFDRELQGNSREIVATKDARGQMIFSEGNETEPTRSGYSITLTVDRAIQEIAFNALKLGIEEAEAVSGSAIVMDPNSGAILAVADYPTFDPNTTRSGQNLMKSRALQDLFEPGSVIKPLAIAGAMEAGLTDLDSKHDCNNGVGFAGGVRFGDAHPPKTQFLTTLETIVHSSNVCTFEIAKLLGKERLERNLRAFGIGEKETRIGFPGQAFGSLSSAANWLPIRFANVAFGQGMMSTALEIAQVYSAFANGGVLLRPYLIKDVRSPDGRIVYSNERQIVRRVFSRGTISRVNKALEQTVTDAATRALLHGYSAAGKTGTSQKIDELKKAYSKTKHRAVFAGFAPASSPRVVVFVLIDEPGKTPHYGALWAAPVFRTIAQESLRYLSVPEDRPRSNSISRASGATVYE
jgi:cell division protein FtsI (penicillin-binding protein 3)